MSLACSRIDALMTAQRTRDIARFWQPLHALGFTVVAADGTPVEDAQSAVTARLLRLRAPHRATFSLRARTGFFTHSIVGIALLLLTAPRHGLLPLAGGPCSLETVCARPLAHYLDNGVVVDLDSVVLVRHGRTEANARRIALGRSEGGAGWSGQLLASTPCPTPRDVGSWHCSTLRRTHQTAATYGVDDPTPHDALDEMEIGAAEGLTESVVIETFASAMRMYLDGDPFAAIVDELGTGLPDGECFVAVLVRAAHCLRELSDLTSSC